MGTCGTKNATTDAVVEVSKSDGKEWHSMWYQHLNHTEVLKSEKYTRVHEAEAKILSQMTIPYEAKDVMVEVSLMNRCQACMEKGWCKGHPQKHEYPIRTVVVGKDQPDKLPIVLVHGFMMGAACFYKWYPLLSKEHKVYAIDVIGMGGSGSPPFDADSVTPEQAEKLLVEPFMNWAQKMGLQKFVLLGHSFGGFVSSAWATREPEKIAQLGLLSPLLGFTDTRLNSFQERAQDSWQRKAVFSVFETAWSSHMTPQTIVRWIPGAESFFRKNAERRFGRAKNLSEEEGKLLAEYVVATMLTPASLEAAATVCFEPFCKPVELEDGTIKTRLSNLKMPIFAIYGDHDWMDRATSEELPNCKFLTLGDSGHHVYFDNPEDLTTLTLGEISATVSM